MWVDHAQLKLPIKELSAFIHAIFFISVLIFLGSLFNGENERFNIGTVIDDFYYF